MFVWTTLQLICQSVFMALSIWNNIEIFILWECAAGLDTLNLKGNEVNFL